MVETQGAPIHKFRGRITKIDKYPKQNNTIVTGVSREHQHKYESSRRYAGSNGTYLEFGEYYGVALDVTFSLYDTDKKTIKINNEEYFISKHVTVDIYDNLMAALGKQRLSPQKYEAIRAFRGSKVDFNFTVLENSLEHIIEDEYYVKAICAMPFLACDTAVLGYFVLHVRKADKVE